MGFRISKINETDATIVAKKRRNELLDKQIIKLNFLVTEQSMARDIERETRISDDKEAR